jgi:hypothetical protein
MKKLLSGFAFLVLFAGGLFAQNPVSKPLTHEIMVKLNRYSKFNINVKLVTNKHNLYHYHKAVNKL